LVKAKIVMRFALPHSKFPFLSALVLFAHAEILTAGEEATWFDTCRLWNDGPIGDVIKCESAYDATIAGRILSYGIPLSDSDMEMLRSCVTKYTLKFKEIDVAWVMVESMCLPDE